MPQQWRPGPWHGPHAPSSCVLLSQLEASKLEKRTRCEGSHFNAMEGPQLLWKLTSSRFLGLPSSYFFLFRNGICRISDTVAGFDAQRSLSLCLSSYLTWIEPMVVDGHVSRAVIVILSFMRRSVKHQVRIGSSRSTTWNALMYLNGVIVVEAAREKKTRL